MDSMTEEELARLAQGQDVTLYPDGLMETGPVGSMAFSSPTPDDSRYQALIQTLAAREQATKAARDAALAKVTTPNSPEFGRDRGIVSALMSVLPIGIGALVRGREGAYLGAQASLLGLNQLDKNLEKREQDQDAIDLFSYNQAQNEYADVRDILQTAQLGDAQAQAVLDNTRERYLNDPLDKEVPEALQREYGVRTYRELAAKQKDRQGDQRDADLSFQREAEERRKQQFGAKQLSQQLPYIGFVGRTGNESDFKFIKQVEQDTNKLNSLQMDLAESLRKNGRKLGTPEAANQDQLVSRMIDQYKKMQGYGANFTVYEMNLAETGIGSPQSFWSFMAKNDLLDRDLAGAVERSRDLNERQKLVALAGIGAFHKKQPYVNLSKEDLKAIGQGGIELDKSGRVTNQDYNEHFIKAAEGMVGIDGSQGRQVTGQGMAPAQERFVQTKKGIWDTKRGRYVTQEEAGAVDGR